MALASTSSQNPTDGFGALTFKSLLWVYPAPMACVKQAQMPGRRMEGLVPERASVRRRTHTRTPPTGIPQGDTRPKAQGIGYLWMLGFAYFAMSWSVSPVSLSGSLALPCGSAERAAIRDQIHPTVVQSSLSIDILTQHQFLHPKSASPTSTRPSALTAETDSPGVTLE
ncbi:hypothetical protein QBC36DRAFT_314684 [Triangularia setosa]|uniref:Uncharacterized protein n=1 Tax=Triangularia setosa TaxID=2587417 RepID=A0AAN7A275_9PEZI|nr:hypothetical protein QBC36DRAFT_314684 [Podospora setosa]